MELIERVDGVKGTSDGLAWPSRYVLLDGLRGLACMAVVLHHMGVVTIGHYAVMVFFVISGYCITASVQSGLKNGVSFGGFMMKRIRRIFPPYMLAVLFFAATRLLKQHISHSNLWHPSLQQWVQNLTLTQWVSLVFSPQTEASQNPVLFVASFWSLNYEEQFYLVMGLSLLMAYRFNVAIIKPVIGLLVAGIIWNLRVPGGWVTGFFLEYWVHFALGSLLYFVMCVYPGRKNQLAFIAAMLLLVIYCLMQIFPLRGADALVEKRAFIELALLSVVTIVLLLIRPLDQQITSSRLWKPLAMVGTISYSLYLVHQFNLKLVSTITSIVVPAGFPEIMVIAAGLMLHIMIGALFWRLCERPFQSVNQKVVQDSV